MFMQALPLWAKDREKEMNLTLVFSGNFSAPSAPVTLRLTGATLYRVTLNGRFLHYGPARGPHGFCRVDELNLTDRLIPGENRLTIEVAGYNCYSFYTLKGISFLQAEVVSEDRVLLATGADGEAGPGKPGFSAAVKKSRLQRTLRYSFQRPFTEIYDLNRDDSEPAVTGPVSPNLSYLPREWPIPRFEMKEPVSLVKGTVRRPQEEASFPGKGVRGWLDEEKEGWCYAYEDVEENHTGILNARFLPGKKHLPLGDSQAVGPGEFLMADMGRNTNGFIFTTLTAEAETTLHLLWDEKLMDGRMAPETWKTVNMITYTLPPGDHELESFETYGFRYLILYFERGRAVVKAPRVREYAYPDCRAVSYQGDDEKLAAVFEAAVQTYRQNTLDAFMDCPTRERAGWLCDSYFTAQSSFLFSGSVRAEKIFLENFLLPREFPFLPKGMLPMCYPGDHLNGRFIPQWAIWYVLELEGYFQRDPRADKGRFKELCYGLYHYFIPFENENGLLEKLESWNFIEWSQANDWVMDVSYPTNMLYSKMLRLMGTWYEDESLLKRAASVKEEVISQSWDGEFFMDNAIRHDEGKLVPTGNRSEVCQYYAYLCGIASREEKRFDPLTRVVLNVFGPERHKTREREDIALANAFIGNYLRMELLLNWELYDQCLDEVKEYFFKMAETTGTLWEHADIKGSLNHGFASYAGVVIHRCMNRSPG